MAFMNGEISCRREGRRRGKEREGTHTADEQQVPPTTSVLTAIPALPSGVFPSASRGLLTLAIGRTMSLLSVLNLLTSSSSTSF